MTDMKYDYPEGLTTCDHLAHDIKQGRFPERSSISQFICERGAPDDKAAPETTAKIAALANRFWSIHPSTIAAMNLSREEFYAREMTRLLTSETERLIALNKKLTEDFNTLALDRSQWQERAKKASIALAAEQAINKDLKIELDEARADMEASLSDFKVAGGQLSEAQDAVSELRAALADQRVFCEALERARSHFAVMTSSQAIRAMQEIEGVLARVADRQALVLHEKKAANSWGS